MRRCITRCDRQSGIKGCLVVIGCSELAVAGYLVLFDRHLATSLVISRCRFLTPYLYQPSQRHRTYTIPGSPQHRSMRTCPSHGCDRSHKHISVTLALIISFILMQTAMRADPCLCNSIVSIARTGMHPHDWSCHPPRLCENSSSYLHFHGLLMLCRLAAGIPPALPRAVCAQVAH